MIERKCLALLTVSLAAQGLLSPADALSTQNGAALDSANIAGSALSVAESTRTSGRCYAAVCRALKPLGVELHGAAAYQARDLLMKDSRFVPLTVHNVEELRTGDIIVYTRSHSHPYGHISVYEGNYEEASDHLSPVTHTQAYGGATVFRLRDECLASAGPPPAYFPPSHQNPQPAPESDWRSREEEPAPAESVSTNRAMRILRRGYRLISGEPVEKTIARKCARFLLGY